MIYRKRTQKLKRYAIDFCDRVRRDFSAVNITTENPLIKFYRYGAFTKCATPELEFAEKTPGGDPIISGYYCNGIIEIYDVTTETPAELKRTIRHECLHFLLDKSGLPNNDSDEVFINFAVIYDARPVALLTR